MRILMNFENRFMDFCKYEKFNRKRTPDTMYEVSVYYKKMAEPIVSYASFVNAEDVREMSPGDGDMSVGLRKGTIPHRVYRSYDYIENVYFINDDTKSEQEIFDEYYKHDKYVERITYKKINMRRWCKKYYDMRIQLDENMMLASRENAENANTEEIRVPDIKHLDEPLTLDEIHMLGHALYMNSPLAALEFLQNRLRVNQKQFALYSERMNDKTYLLFTVPEEVKWDTMKVVEDLFVKFNITSPDYRCNMGCHLNHGKTNKDIKTHTHIYEFDQKKNTSWCDERCGNYDFMTKAGEVLRVTRSQEDPNMLVIDFDDERWKKCISYVQHMFIKGVDDLIWDKFDHISITAADIELYKQKLLREYDLSINYIPKVYPRDYIIREEKEEDEN